MRSDRAGVASRAVAFMLLVATGCARRSTDAAPESGGTVHVAVFEPLEPLSPILVTRPLTNEFMDHVLPPLAVLDERQTLEPRLARWVGEFGLTLEFRLQPRRWEDGRPVTAARLVTTVDLLRAPRVPAPERARVERLRRRWRWTIRLCCSPLGCRTRGVAAMHSWRRCRRTDCDGRHPKSLDTWPVTRRPLACGPFRVAAWSPRRLVLVRNDTSGWPPTRLDSVVVRARDYESAEHDFVRGAIDLSGWLAGRPTRSGAPSFGSARRSPSLVGPTYSWAGTCAIHDSPIRWCGAPRRARWIDRASSANASTDREKPVRGPLVAALDYTDTTARVRLRSRRRASRPRCRRLA